MSIFDKVREWYNEETSIEFGITLGKGDMVESATWVLDTTKRPIKLERIEEREQTRKSDHKSNIWDSKPSHEASLRSNAKGKKD